MFGFLEEYVKEEGNANVPQSNEGHENLGRWINKQRQVYQQQKLNKGDVPQYLQNRFQRLEKIGWHRHLVGTIQKIQWKYSVPPTVGYN
jgi:hypothetical protein